MKRSAVLSLMLIGLFLSLVFAPAAAQAQSSLVLGARANPSVVQFGPQPQGSPLILKVEVSRAPSIREVTVDLSQLFGAKYYDPNSDSEKSASAVTPLYRVYTVDGKSAYRAVRQKSKTKTETIYCAAATHEELKGEVLATRTWQVELPDVGLKQGRFELRVAATDQTGYRSTAAISLQIVSDLTPPELSVSLSPALLTEVVRPGDELSIRATAQDDLTGVFRVYLDEEAREVLGEEAGLVLEKAEDGWELTTRLPEVLAPGTYELQVKAEDRAGNVNEARVKLEVVPDVNSIALRLKKGWNLISTPRPLADKRVESVFAGLPVEKVLTCLGGEEREAVELRPGLGYLVEAKEECELVLKFKEMEASTMPGVLELPEGWNLIGLASASLEPFLPLQSYLGEDLAEKWVVIYDENLEEARPQSLYPYIWASGGFATTTGEPYYEDPSHNLPVVELGQAYWLYLKDEGVLVP